jgi:hypothetical protein
MPLTLAAARRIAPLHQETSAPFRICKATCPVPGWKLIPKSEAIAASWRHCWATFTLQWLPNQRFLWVYDRIFTRLEGELDVAYGQRLDPCLVSFHVQLMVQNWLTTQLDVRDSGFFPASNFCMGFNVLQSHNNLSWLPTVTSIHALLALRVLPHVMLQGTAQSPVLVAPVRAVVGGAAAEVVPHHTPGRSMRNSNRDSRFVGGTPFAVNVHTRRVMVALSTAGTPPRVMRNGTSRPVFTSWHARSQCFDNCERVADHGELSTEEEKSFQMWCQLAYA